RRQSFRRNARLCRPRFRSPLNASQERWSLRADARPALAADLVALAVFGGGWALLHHGFYKRGQIVDTPVYQHYGDAMVNGQVPYLDFSVEYPPAALPVFLLPAIGDHQDAATYQRNFERLMVICGLLAIAGVAIALGALRAGPERLLAALAFAALAPLALGSVILTRFDLWPTALLVLGLAFVLAERRRLGLGVLGLAASAVAAFLAFGKVLSPQFLIWLIPLVPLVRGRRGVAASAVLLVALVLTQLWFPYRYWRLALQQDAISSWLVFARDIVLVGLVVVLAMPRRAQARTT